MMNRMRMKKMMDSVQCQAMKTLDTTAKEVKVVLIRAHLGPSRQIRLLLLKITINKSSPDICLKYQATLITPSKPSKWM